MKRYCLALDLVNDKEKIAAYERYHQQVWPGIISSIRNAGIEQMEIYRFGNRLFMIMEVTAAFSFEQKASDDLANEKVQEWEQLMWEYQQAIPGTPAGGKWVLMDKIFSLADQVE
jgi:L-rhamnose mutarotase